MRKYYIGRSSLCISRENGYAWYRRGEVALNVKLGRKPRITLHTSSRVFDLGYLSSIVGTRFVCKHTKLVDAV